MLRLRIFLYKLDDYACKDCQGLVQETVQVQPIGKALLLDLKRFDFDERGLTTRKLDDVVKFPQTLTLGAARYEFTALIEHLGETVTNGHYVAYVNANNFWRCDDSDVEQMPWKEIKERQAYLLAYVRTDM